MHANLVEILRAVGSPFDYGVLTEKVPDELVELLVPVDLGVAAVDSLRQVREWREKECGMIGGSTL